MAGHNVGLKLDHVIVWGDVDRVGAEVSQALGLEPVDGGVHPGIGTRNALFAMDGNRFLEVLGPDAAQESRAWGPDDDHPDGALWWWVARTRSSLHDVRHRLAELGVAPGPIERGSRIRPDGERLEWETVDPSPEPYGTALPFVIRWKEGPPLRGLTDVCELRELRRATPMCRDCRRCSTASVSVPSRSSAQGPRGSAPSSPAPLERWSSPPHEGRPLRAARRA